MPDPSSTQCSVQLGADTRDNLVSNSSRGFGLGSIGRCQLLSPPGQLTPPDDSRDNLKKTLSGVVTWKMARTIGNRRTFQTRADLRTHRTSPIGLSRTTPLLEKLEVTIQGVRYKRYITTPALELFQEGAMILEFHRKSVLPGLGTVLHGRKYGNGPASNVKKRTVFWPGNWDLLAPIWFG
ncbi:hypothetical protein Bbelb_218730 [Branchiostoma belcheri]|nr:hypothetical protein Bbelb_218730 [Branchiostoma belcheri]